MTTDNVVSEARTAILRTFFALMPADIPPERWRDLGDAVDDQLHVAWAAGYHARAYEEEATSTPGAQVLEVPAILGAPTAPVAAATAMAATVAA